MTRSTRSLRVVALLLAASCGSRSTTAPTTGVPDASCRGRWQETAAWAASLEATPSGGLARIRFPLVQVARALDGLGDRTTFTLMVGRDRLDAGSEDATLDHLQETLAHVAWRARKLHNLPGSATPEAALGIAPDVPWARVVAVTEPARAAGYDASFLFELPRSVEPPGWSWQQLGHDLMDSTGLWPAEGDRVASVLAPCPELVRRASSAPRAAWVASLRGFEDACRCRIDDRGLRGLLWDLHPPDGATSRLVHLAGPDAPDAVVIAASPDAPWSEMGPRVAALPSGASVRVVVTR